MRCADAAPALRHDLVRIRHGLELRFETRLRTVQAPPGLRTRFSPPILPHAGQRGDLDEAGS